MFLEKFVYVRGAVDDEHAEDAPNAKSIGAIGNQIYLLLIAIFTN